MKIGILSYPLNNNYGNYLQAYALVSTLQRMGHEVVYIHRRHNKPRFLFRLKYFVKTIIKDIYYFQFENPIYIYEQVYMYNKGCKMIPFFEKNIPHTKAYYTSKDLEKECQCFDAIIVGSDQVWRAGLLHNIEDYFLEFLKNEKTRRIAYAASFGKKETGYTDAQLSKCGRLISKFNAVSLRESQGIDIISNFGWKVYNPQVVLDPTLLLNREDYLNMISSCKGKKDDGLNTIFCYILDQSGLINNVINKVCGILNMEPYNILLGKDKREYQYKSIETWLNCFNNTSFVITDSFHGTVFSILFNVPFIVVCNESRGTDRITSLLQIFGLNKRMLSDKKSVEQVLNDHIDWSVVNNKLHNQRTISMNFLQLSLDK